ncbi:MAG: lipoate--protein ligase family protein [Spirochaetales bacterium]|nr:lipoate--protein ligase family protein [Spirochaetales bacterium]
MSDAVVIESRTTDLHLNLAFEEYALDRLCGERRILFLWQAARAVVVGRFQDPRRETSPPLLARSGVQLGRRISGGGAVYQDAGNLNFAFFAPKGALDRSAVFAVVLRALAAWNLKAEVSGGRDILCRGAKVSGNAFAVRRAGELHHGTLLVSSDLADLGRFLIGVSPGDGGRAVASRPSPVANLSDLAPGVTVSALKAELVKQAAGLGTVHRPVSMDSLTDKEAFEPYAAKMRGEAWIYAYPPSPGE